MSVEVLFDIRTSLSTSESQNLNAFKKLEAHIESPYLGEVLIHLNVYSRLYFHYKYKTYPSDCIS